MKMNREPVQTEKGRSVGPASVALSHRNLPENCADVWEVAAGIAASPATRGLHSSTFQLNLSRFGHTSPCPPV